MEVIHYIMPSTKFNRDPPIYDQGSKGDATSYLKHYPLMTQRFMHAIEDKTSNVNTRNIRRDISSLIDPLAFIGGYTEEVEEVEDILEELEKGDIDRSFRIKTVIKNVGSHSGILSSKENCVLWTILNIDHKPSDIETIHIPSENGSDVNWTDMRVTMTRWETEAGSILSDLNQGDELEVFIGPSDEGIFELGFTFNRK